MRADDHCLPTETIRQCYHRFVPELPTDKQEATETAAMQKATSDMHKSVANANTGITNLTSTLQSALKDFLSVLSGAVDMSAQGNDAKPVTLDYNIPVNLLGEQTQVKFQAVLAKPDLSADLLQRLGDNAAGKKALQDSLSYGDDVTVSATLNPATQGFGRSFIPHRKFFQNLLAVAFTSDPAADEALQNLIDDFGDAKLDTPITLLFPDDTVKQQRALATIETAMRAAAPTAAFELSRHFAFLLNNQPQLYGSAIYHSRTEIAGSNETSAKLTYELGAHNLNWFYAANADCTPTAGTRAATSRCVNKRTQYAEKSAAATSDRFSLSVQYNRTDHIAVDLPQYTINYTVPSGHKFIYSVIYGRPMSVSQPTEKDGRVDFSLNSDATKTTKAEDVVSLSHRTPLAAATTVPPHDRLVASITFTQKLSDTISVPVSLIYANHAQFLSTVDKKLNVHFGLVYKLPTKQ